VLSVAPITLFAIAERQDEITQRSTTAECKQLNHNLYFGTLVASKKGVFTVLIRSLNFINLVTAKAFSNAANS